MQLQTTRLRMLGIMLAGFAAALPIGGSAQAAGCRLDILADLPVTMVGNRAGVPTKINGKDTRFWLDSGGFFSIMSQAKAAELGLVTVPLPVGFFIAGIGGRASVELTRIKSFGIAGHELKNMEFLVGGSDPGNGLIGRNILGLRDTEFDLADGSVKLFVAHDCEHASMAYWAPGKPYFAVPLLPDANSADHVFKLPVTINGTRLEALFDTGAQTSGLSRSAARRAGIDLAGPGVLAMETGGIGRHRARGWVVPVAKVAIGDEQILNTHLDVFDDGAAGNGLPDLLLGADYMMAHHIYVARGQRRIYFTYTGGRPFGTSRELAEAPKPEVAVAPVALPAGMYLVDAVANSGGEPTTADGFARRGAARLSARDLPGAIADLSEAIRQSPGTAGFYADRARAYRLADNAAAEIIDIDKALTLDPGMGGLLRLRAAQRLAGHDRAGALSDAEAAARVTAPTSWESGGLAALFVRLRQPARAIAMFDAVIAAHPDDSQLDSMLNGRCWARALANVELDKALADCSRAIRHNGSRPDWLDSRGLVHFRQAHYPLAIGDYDAALKLHPGMAWSLYMRGQARLALGQMVAARTDELAALAIQPDIGDEVAAYGIKGAKAP